MHQFNISQQVAQQLPQMLVVVITAKGLDNSAPNTKVENFANVSTKEKRTGQVQFTHLIIRK